MEIGWSSFMEIQWISMEKIGWSSFMEIRQKRANRSKNLSDTHENCGVHDMRLPDAQFQEKNFTIHQQVATEAQRQAREDAVAQIPEATAQNLSHSEGLLENFYNLYKQSALNFFQTKAIQPRAELEQLLTKLKTASISADEAIQKIQSVKTEVETEWNRERPEYVTLARDNFEKKSRLKKFRLENNIIHDADYPASKTASLLTIGTIIFFESLIGSFLIHNSNNAEMGIVTAILISSVIGALAVVLMAACGFFVRYIFHIQPKKRKIGFASIFVAITTAFFFSAIIAELRSNSGNFELLRSLRFGSFGSGTKTDALADAGALAFMILILIAGLYKGYSITDRYPGLEEMDRPVKHIEELLRTKEGLIRIIVVDAQKRFSAELSKLNSERSFDANRFRKIVDELNTLSTNQMTEFSLIDENYKASIKRYRQENQKIRSTPPPKYFETSPAELIVEHSIVVEKSSAETISKFNELAEIENNNKAMMQNAENTLSEIISDLTNYINNEIQKAKIEAESARARG